MLSDSNGAQPFGETNQKKYLGVIISSDLKWNKQCSAAFAKTYRILRQIKNSFTFKDKNTHE